LIAACKSGHVTILATLNNHRELLLQDSSEAISEAKFSPEGMQILIAYDDGKVAL